MTRGPRLDQPPLDAPAPSRPRADPASRDLPPLVRRRPVARASVRGLLVALPLLIAVAVALAADLIAPADPVATDLTAALRPPDATHWLGTDQLGRDQLSRLIWAARTSMTVAGAVLALALAVGLLLGAVAALAGRLADRLVGALVEFTLSMPALLVALAVLGLRGAGTGSLVLALSLLAWAPYARVARGAVLAYRSGPAHDALTGLGAHPVRILLRHALPTAVRPALVLAGTEIGAVVLAVATLSFLGLGITPPTPEWGQMLVESRPYLGTAWWLWLPPGVALTAVALSGNLIGERLGLPPELRRWRRVYPSREPSPAARRTRFLRRRRHLREPVRPPVQLPPAEPVLSVRDLRVRHHGRPGTATTLARFDLDVRPGEIVALVGESGAGKSTALLAPLGLLTPTAEVTGRVWVAGVPVLGAPPGVLREVRGRRVGVVFQDAAAALNPLRRVGAVIAEGLPPGTGDRDRRVRELLHAVGLPEADRVARSYPHQLSGGMRQRVLIAAALAGDPAVLVADEPTTALDSPVQAEVIALLDELRRSRGLAVLLVSHDLALVAQIADRVLVLHRGRVVDQGPPAQVMRHPRHPHTRALVDAAPAPPGQGATCRPRGPAALVDPAPAPPGTGSDPGPGSPDRGEARHPSALDQGGDRGRPGSAHHPALDLRAVTVTHPGRREPAVDNLDLRIGAGEIMGLVGESGSGKTTLARTVTGLRTPDRGAVLVDGVDLTLLRGRNRRFTRRRVQLIPQDPGASLDPHRTVRAHLVETLAVHGTPRLGRPARVDALLDLVGLPAEVAHRRPGELSGGECQRVALARALAVRPRLLVCDEPVTALDTTTQARVLDLITDLCDRLGTACLFISHDLAVVARVAGTVTVLDRGRVVDRGPVTELFGAGEQRRHPRTARLLAAVPTLRRP